MRSLTKTAVLAGLAALGLAAAAKPSQAALLPYTYSFLPSTNGYLESLTLSAPAGVSLSDVNLTETVLGGSGISDSTLIGNIAAGTTVTSDTDFLFPLSFGDQPENTQFDPQSGPLPFVLTVTGTGSDGQALRPLADPDLQPRRHPRRRARIRHDGPARRRPRPARRRRPAPQALGVGRPMWAALHLPAPPAPKSGPGVLVFCGPPCYNNPIVERGRFSTVSFLSAPALKYGIIAGAIPIAHREENYAIHRHHTPLRGRLHPGPGLRRGAGRRRHGPLQNAGRDQRRRGPEGGRLGAPQAGLRSQGPHEGIYVVMHFTGQATVEAELRRVFQISEDQIRYLIVGRDEEQDSPRAAGRAERPRLPPLPHPTGGPRRRDRRLPTGCRRRDRRPRGGD